MGSKVRARNSNGTDGQSGAGRGTLTDRPPSHGNTRRSNRLTVMNAFESLTSSENGRHWRNASVWVMFVMKFSHATVWKFVENVESNACGNGVGSTGGLDGTFVFVGVIVVADALLEVALDEAATDNEEPVGLLFCTVVAMPEVAGRGSGAACRLCGVQSWTVDQGEEREEDRTSNAAGWVRYRVESATKMRMRGTSTAVQRIRRPIRFFSGSEYECSSSSSAEVVS